jgi:hypothetical protein
MVSTLLLVLTFTLTAKADVPTPPPVSDMGSQTVREFVLIQPGDFVCTEAHQGGFGQHIRGKILFQPLVGDTKWWWSKIEDYDQRITRIRSFMKILDDKETCADYQADLPKSGGSFSFERSAVGFISGSTSGLQTGNIVERVKMTISPHLVLEGENNWIDWSVDAGLVDPQQSFSSSLLNKFEKYQEDVQLTTNLGMGLQCKVIENKPNLIFNADASYKNNAIIFRRIYGTAEECADTLTKLTEALEARGRAWTGMVLKARRTLYTTTRSAHVDECDTVRVERVETQVEGLKFVGTNFITLRTVQGVCSLNEAIL